MITRQSLEAHFEEVSSLANGVLVMKDALPAFFLVYYLDLGHQDRADLVVVSKDQTDSNFGARALAVARQCPDPLGHSRLLKVPIPGEALGDFTHLLFVPPTYHRYFAGRLDDARTSLFWCVPIYGSEFSGEESPDLFGDLAHTLISTLDWRRSCAPRTMARIYNPRTGGGTRGREPVPISSETLAQALLHLDGVGAGFIELTSYRGDYAEIVSPAPGRYTLRHQTDAAPRSMDLETLRTELFAFLTQDDPVRGLS